MPKVRATYWPNLIVYHFYIWCQNPLQTVKLKFCLVRVAFGKPLGNPRSLDSKTLATLAFCDAFDAKQGLLT